MLETDTKDLRASLLPSSCKARANTGEDDWMETPPQRSQQDSFYRCHHQQLLSIDCTDSYTTLLLRLREIWYPARRVFIQSLEDIMDHNKIVLTLQCVMFLSTQVTATLPFLSQHKARGCVLLFRGRGEHMYESQVSPFIDRTSLITTYSNTHSPAGCNSSALAYQSTDTDGDMHRNRLETDTFAHTHIYIHWHTAEHAAVVM